MANQTQIPVIQNDDVDFVQMQQNTNKVIRNLYNQIVDLQAQVQDLTIIGEVKIANLTVSQFASAAGSGWLICDGQSCVSTKYERLTGNTTVPTLTVGGLNTFIRVN